MNKLRSTTAHVSGEIVTLTLVALAAAAWWVTSIMSADMGADSMVTPMSLGPFLLAWSLMMAAIMLPAVTPVVRLYQRAATAGRVAPSGYFVLLYLVVWALSGLPAYLLWRQLAMPLTEGATWALRLAGVTLLFAGAYQLTPLKRACLRHCRSPMSYFMRLRGSLERPGGAIRAGLTSDSMYCCGCCAALVAVLVVTTAMNLWWRMNPILVSLPLALLVAVLSRYCRTATWSPRRGSMKSLRGATGAPTAIHQ